MEDHKPRHGILDGEANKPSGCDGSHCSRAPANPSVTKYAAVAEVLELQLCQERRAHAVTASNSAERAKIIAELLLERAEKDLAVTKQEIKNTKDTFDGVLTAVLYRYGAVGVSFKTGKLRRDIDAG